MRVFRILFYLGLIALSTSTGWSFGRKCGLNDYLVNKIELALTAKDIHLAEALVVDLPSCNPDAATRLMKAIEDAKTVRSSARTPRKKPVCVTTTTTKSTPRREISPRTSLTGTGIRVAAARSRTMIGGCYSLGLARDPSLSGEVMIEFTVNTDGSVANARIKSSSLSDEGVEECVLGVVKAWNLNRRSSAATFEYPFTFEPG
jgi:TonB family protein